MALNNKGLSLSELGNNSEAIESFDKALFTSPENYILYDNKGYSLYKLGKIDEAIQLASKSISLNHDYANAWYNLAIYTLEKNMTEDSVSNLRNAIMLDSSYLKEFIQDKDFDKIRNDTKFIEILKEFRNDSQN